MKKYKKLSALLMAFVITAGTISSLSAGALAHFDSKEEVDEFIEKSYKVPADSFFTLHTEWYVSNRDYITESKYDNSFDIYTLVGGDPDIVSFDLKADIDDEALNEIIAGICPDAEYIKIGSGNYNSKSVTIAGVDPFIHPRFNVYEEMRKKDVTLDQARKLHDLLNDSYELQNFEFHQKSACPEKTSSPITEYSNVQSSESGLSTLEEMQNYIAENNLDWSIVTDSASKPYTYTDGHNTFVVSAGENLSAEETYKVAEQIYNDLGFNPYIITLTSANISEDIVIDLHNNIAGDANDDGELSLADAITIMQAIGNPDEYSLTPQGEFNADIAGDCDGVTNMDALVIQRKLIGLE